MVYSTVFQNLIVPTYDLVRRTSRYKCGRILEKTQHLSRDKIERIQRKNLRALIRHAYTTVPYYHRLFDERGLRPGDIKTARDLGRLPVLRKADVRKNFIDLMSRSYPRKQLILSETGGTGSPLKFYITREQMSWEVAAEYRAYSWANYKLGDRCFMFWGSHRDLRVNILRRIAGILQRTVVVDPFVLSNEVLSGFVDMLEKFNPEVIRGYATPVYMMAKYLLKRGIDIVRPKTVITSAEVLYDPMRKTIEEAFGCPVFDFYGCREIGAIAAECHEHSGYHIAAENVVVEFARNGEPVNCEEKGTILLTGLRNYGMPLIRYENGDVGKPTTDTCSCGKGLPLMESLEGRITQFLVVRDKKTGQIVPIYEPVVEFVILSLKFSPDGFRVIQESLDHVVVQISDKHVGSADIDFLIARLRSYFGEETKIEVQCLNRLPPLPSGKRSVLISKVNPFEQAS